MRPKRNKRVFGDREPYMFPSLNLLLRIRHDVSSSQPSCTWVTSLCSYRYRHERGIYNKPDQATTVWRGTCRDFLPGTLRGFSDQYPLPCKGFRALWCNIVKAWGNTRLQRFLSILSCVFLPCASSYQKAPGVVVHHGLGKEAMKKQRTKSNAISYSFSFLAIWNTVGQRQ